MKSVGFSAGPFVLVALFCLTTLFSTATVLSIVLFLDNPASNAVASGGSTDASQQVVELQRMVDALEERLSRMENAPLVAVDRSRAQDREPKSAELPLRNAGSENLGGPSSSPKEGQVPEFPGDRALGIGNLEKLMKLRGEGNQAERLALAREMLADSNSTGRWMALQVLVEQVPREGLTELRTMIERGESSGNQSGAGGWERAFRGLASASGIDLGAELTALYRIGDQEVKSAAARTLQQQGDDTLMRELLADLETQARSTDVSERLQVVSQIGQFGNESASRLLVAFLSDESPEVRLRALQAMSMARSADTLAQVERLTSDPDERVRTRATLMLESMRARQSVIEGRRAPRSGR